MGGTGFIGRVPVRYLLNDGHEVFVASSGETNVSFAGEAKYLHFDRFNPLSVKESISNLDHFDAVYDQLAFRIKDVKELIDILAGKTDSYIFTSSAAVYSGKSGLLSEDQFDPFSYEYDDKESEKSYADGKRNVEAMYTRSLTLQFHLRDSPAFWAIVIAPLDSRIISEG